MNSKVSGPVVAIVVVVVLAIVGYFGYKALVPQKVLLAPGTQLTPPSRQ